ncbi:MAG TPA: type II secretion system secretin GspD [Pseudomonadales bacterium]|nr:type II secretion system secretin GspD [Pseudomonadales bacterium]
MDKKTFAYRAVQCGLVMLCAGLLVNQGYAQTAPVNNPVSTNSSADQKITVAFDNADVKDVIRWASDLTEKNMIVHPGVAGKKITIVAGEPMTREEAWQVFLSALQVNGLAVMESGDTVKVLPEPEAKMEKIPVMDAGGKQGKEDIVVRIVKVKNLAAQQLIGLLKPLTPNSAHLAAYPESNTLIIADRAGNIDQIVDIINRIDQAGTIDIEIIKLEFASAKDVSKILTELVQKSGGAKEGGAAPPSRALNITSDERSNSILMTGDPVMRMQMRKLIQKLDLPLSGDGNTQVVYLNYITAKDIQPILEGVGGSAKKGAAKEAAGAEDVEVNVQALEQTNAVVITAPPSMLNTMKGVIAKLDVRRQQVLVEALIVEVSEDVGRDIGVFWTGQGDAVGAVGAFGSNNASVTGTNSSGVADRLRNLPVSGLSVGFYDAGDLVGLIRALEKDTNSNVLSTPTIIALDNEEAKILVGESVPFKTGVENNNNTTVVTGGVTTPNNSAFNNDFVQIERKDIGVELKVTPRINQEGVLTLEVEQKVESIDESANVGGESGASDIITNKREIKTTALVKDDGVLVLGGLIRDEMETSDNGVPYLSKIPILGRLFQGTSKHSVKKNLMVFIHPRILRDDVDVANSSRHYYDNMRSNQEDFNAEELKDFLRIDKSSPQLAPWANKNNAAKRSSAGQSVPTPAMAQ